MVVGDRLFDGHVDDLAIGPCHHAVVLALRDQVDGVGAEGRGDQPVAPARRRAPLNVAKNGDAALGAGRFGNALRHVVADAAEPLLAVDELLHDRASGAVLHRLGNDDQRKVAAALPDVEDLLGDLVDAVRDLRDQDHVGAAGDTRRQGNMAGVAAHDLQHHNAMVARGGRLQAVQRLGRHRACGVEADGQLGKADIVVDRLGHADDLQFAQLGQLAQNAEAAVAADDDDRIETEFAAAADDLGRAILDGAVHHGVGERIALVGRAEDRAALAHHRTVEHLRRQHFVLKRSRQQSCRTFPQADHCPTEYVGAVNRRADNGIEAGAVAAACENADALFT